MQSFLSYFSFAHFSLFLFFSWCSNACLLALCSEAVTNKLESTTLHAIEMSDPVTYVVTELITEMGMLLFDLIRHQIFFIILIFCWFLLCVFINYCVIADLALLCVLQFEKLVTCQQILFVNFQCTV